jgi:acetyl esterase/lipase
MPLDPQAAAFLDKLASSHAPPMHTLSVADARALAMPPRVPREPMGKIESRTIPGPAGEFAVRIYHPHGSIDGSGPLPIVLFFHGGGWVIGSIGSYDAMCRRLCNASGCIFISVDYRLAPEHKYPAAVQDCLAATVWAARHAGELGGDPQRIAVCGDSAGGNLAAVVALLARDQGAPPIAHQALIYPITDYMPEFDSGSRLGSGYFLTRETIAWFWKLYLNDESEGEHTDVSPLRAGDFTGLPPATVLVAEYDPLIDEGLAYADRLEAAGVPVVRIVSDGQIHGFLRRLDTFDAAASECVHLGRTLRDALKVQCR